MRIVFTVADLQPESGGPSRSVGSLATAVAELEVDVDLVALAYAGDTAAAMVPNGTVRTTLVSCHGALARRLKWTAAYAQSLRRCCEPRGAVVMHDSGLWLPTNHAVASVARSTATPLIVSPRGMLSEWALRFRGLKKRVAWQLYQRRDLHSASLLHATCAAEAQDLRKLGLSQPIAVVPNGVKLPPSAGPQDYATTRLRTRERTALFLSRIHPSKGLLDLVQAWAALAPVGWRVTIAGGDENGYRAEVEAAVRKANVQADFDFIGEVTDGPKWELYRKADVFVLPTRSENFGIVVAEALASGLPVITTREAPWGQLQTHGCGWWVSVGVEPLVVALREAISLSDEQRREMGARGRKLIEDNYTWPSAAGRMLAVYRWMLGQGEKPDCVVES
jgi:glycosyltransferase involved in cell wall biosynthesis